MDCDVLAPCALEQVITAENADSQGVDRLRGRERADRRPRPTQILDDRGVLVLPDVLANAGGVVVSYFEWVQGLQEYFWKEDEVNAKLNDIVTRAFAETWALTRTARSRCAQAAYALAVGRVAEATTPAASIRSPRVTLYHAAGCHLCESARRVLAQVRADTPFELEEVDITGDAELEAPLPRTHPGRRGRRRGGLYVLRPSGRPAPPALA